MPKVSAIMGVYNGSKGLRRAVESILNQTFSDFELVICDDKSTDNSSAILQELALQDKRIILLKNEQNLRLSKTLNNCLAVASGEYIARMDDDDIAYPERFEKQIAFLDNQPDYAIVGTGRTFYDESGVWGKDVEEKGERTKIDIFLGHTFVHPSVMMRKSALLAVEGYSTEAIIGRAEDYDLWCKLYVKGYKGYNLGEILMDYYEAQHSFNKRQYKYRVNEYKLARMWHKKMELPFKYSLHSYRPLIVGLFPKVLLKKYHERVFKL